MAAAKRVVIVDEDVRIALQLRKLCEESGTQVVGVAHNVVAAQDTVLRERPDYVIMDLRLGESQGGVEVAQSILSVLPEIKFIFVTGSRERMAIARIQSVNPDHVFMKPVAARSVRAALR